MDHLNTSFTLKNTYYILEIDQRKNRLYLTLMDYWNDKTELEEFLEDIQNALKKMSPNFTMLVDMTRYKGTSQELQYLHIKAQELSVEYTVSRIADVIPNNPVVKMFSEVYSHETGASTMLFENRNYAERWLDFY